MSKKDPADKDGLQSYLPKSIPTENSSSEKFSGSASKVKQDDIGSFKGYLPESPKVQNTPQDAQDQAPSFSFSRPTSPKIQGTEKIG